MKNNPLKVCIVIPTMNRPDFVIRQLKYYAAVKSPHPVYIGDASNGENSQKLQSAIEKLRKYLTINYYTYPKNTSVVDTHLDLDKKIKEKYYLVSGDDDYQVPDSLTKCAEFLEHNPEYSSASGHAIVFRLKNNGVYGELNRISDFPRNQIESSTAAQRLIDFMANYSPTALSVQKTEHVPKYYSEVNTIIKDVAFAGEVLRCAMPSVLGKSKLLNCLGLVKQQGNPKPSGAPNTFDWIIGKDWNSSFDIFCEILAKEIAAVDNIDIDEARKAPKQAFWRYLNIWLPYDYKKIYGATINDRKKQNVNLLRRLRLRLGQKLPRLKNIYLRISHSLPNAPREIFYEVTRPSSPYYKDFQPILGSLTGKYQDLYRN